MQGGKELNCEIHETREFSRTQRMILLLLGEKAGMRESVYLTFTREFHWTRIFRQGMRRAGLQLIENRVADALRVAAQMRIPEPQCFNATGLQKFFPLRVVFALVGKTMLVAVQFHIQFRFLAKEIQIVNADGMLAAKLVAVEPPVAQPAPHEFFRPGFILAKLAGAGDFGHDGNLGNGGKTEKFVLTLALNLTFSPGEKEQQSHISGFADERPANPVAGFQWDGGCFSLSLEERAGVRTVVKTEICVLTFALNLTFSPGEKEQQSHDFGFADERPANPGA